MQSSDELATLPVGTEVSAKYKGAFCEAKVKKVGRQVKCKVTFKLNLGSFTLCESSLNYSGPLVSGCVLEARHPEKGTMHEAVVNKIYDQSQYTVVFDDGDIATLKRNSLHMKSGKHFNASESLDNLPLTHPEHFGTPVGSCRKKRMDDEEEDDDEEDSSEDEADMVPYISKLGSVVCVEVADKKNTKTKENWFPGLVVSPHAQDQRKINTKEDFLIRSFRDHRYFTVPRKECKRFHKDSGKKVTEASLLTAIEHANAYLANNDRLPDHWDREILFDMRDDSSTEGSSEDEEVGQLSDDEDMQSPEEKDHLVAELYKHMDDRGTPINRTPCIGNHEVDLYLLFRLVQKLGGAQRVTNNNQWRSVAKRLGFETNWCVNQVRVCYKRYLQSFEELYKTLGCTFITHPRGNNLKVRHSSGRPLVRGVRVGSKLKDEDAGGGSDRSSVSSQEGGEGGSGIKKEKLDIKEELLDEIDYEASKFKVEMDKKAKKSVISVDKIIKEEPLDEEMEVYDRSEKVKDTKKKIKEDLRMSTRPRRDSTSSLTAAVELKAKKEDIGDACKTFKDTKKKMDKVKEDEDNSINVSVAKVMKVKKETKKKVEEEKDNDDIQEDECNSDLDAGMIKKKSKTPLKNKSKVIKSEEDIFIPESPISEGEEHQHLKPNVECQVGDKIKVFWRHGQIYEAKIMKSGKDKKEGKYYVHYQGWNQRYDEWITRGKIAENLTWDENPKSHKARELKAEKHKKKSEKNEKNENMEKVEKTKSEEEEEKQDTDEKNTSEEEKEEPDIGDKKEECRKKILKRAKSVTPTSTPSSSRTSSPASMKRTKSPAPKKAMSPSMKEKTPVKEKKKDKETPPVKRTASPVPPPQKSPLLKRQSSRSSMFKPSDDNEENEEMIETTSDGEAQDDKTPRRSNRGEKEKAESDKKVKTTPRSNSNTRVGEKKEKSEAVPEAEQVDEEGKKISESIISQPSVRLGKMRSLTPIKKNPADADVNDPYVFQEPDESPPKFETPLKLCLDMGDEEECISPKETTKLLTGKKEDFDKKSYEHSDTENIVRLAEEHFPGDFKILNPLQGNEESTIECSKINTNDVIIKTEDDKDKKPILQMTDRYASLFPHLASLRAQHTEFQFTSVSTELGTSSTTISSASIISEIVESSIIKSQSDPDEKEKKDLVKIEIIPMEDKEDETKPVKESLTPSKKNKNKKTKKVRSMRKNPSHKSREVVTDSDSDSESEDASKSKASTPSRRKTIDSERPPPVGTLKRLKPLEIDDEASSMKRLKRRKDDDTSLMCEETIPRSPQPQTPHSPDASVSQEERSGSRLEMPFATVPQSLAGPRTGHTAGPVRSPDCSPPPTPDSDQSGEAPLTIDARIKEEGNKSPGESSEVDMESLSGQGKAGSDDSRLDIEFPSCIDTKRTSRGRRRQAPVKKEVEEVLVKSPETSFKRKRKIKPETPGRGRGKGRGRHGSGVGRGVGRQLGDEDCMESVGTREEVGPLDRLDDTALAALAQPKPNNTSKYNFYVQLDPAMDPTERISKLQGTLEQLRKTYLNIKGDLSAIERRRKKIRRKERDRSMQTTEVAA